jgi:hypothetical protein
MWSYIILKAIFVKQSKKIKRNTKIKQKEIKVSLILYNTIKIIKMNNFNLNIKRLYISYTKKTKKKI